MIDPNDALFPTRHTPTPEMPTEKELAELGDYEMWVDHGPISYHAVSRLIAAVRTLQAENKDLRAELADAERTIKAMEDEYDERFCQP